MRAGVESPLGALRLTAGPGPEGGTAVTALDWAACEDPPSGVLAEAARELDAYFAGSRAGFTVPLAPGGSEFQRRFLNRLSEIPYGETVTYGELAGELGVPAQAIGQACGANPLPILIPCHRVLGASGLGGYSGAGGVETKVALLRLEGAAGLLI